MAKKFLNKTVSQPGASLVEVTVTVPEKSVEDLQVLLSKCTPDELRILRKVSENPFLKNLAIGKAKEYVR